MTTYSGASKAAWFEDRYLGSSISPNVGVLHTTEGTTLPGYNGGATAPNYTAVPDFKRKRLKWFVHFSDERSARALQNLAGGVETNTLNALQVELVGTCDPATSRAWTKAGHQHIYWPNAPMWALRDLAHFVADMNKRHSVPIVGAKRWAPYPDSYGSGGQRFSFEQWRNFYGWCGHQHVPENVHGDPGNLAWETVEKLAKQLVAGATPVPKEPKRSTRWDTVWEQADKLQDSLPSKAAARRRSLERIKQLAARWSVRH